MSKPWTPKRQTVELQPSKIRREPPPQPSLLKQALLPDDATERETWTVVIGVMLFGVAITFLTIWFSDFTAG